MGVAVSDITTWYRIAQVADKLIEECVGPYGVGGEVKNVGQSPPERMIILTIEPFDIGADTCSRTP